MVPLSRDDAGAPYAQGFATLDREVSVEALPVEGALPPWLSGALIRTGPARFEVGSRSFEHWFDGLAMLHRFGFREGRVSYANRYVRSRAHEGAMREGRITHAEFMTDPCYGLFGRVMSWFRPDTTDNPDVNVSELGGEVVALTETPIPIRFDPETLETLGPLAYGGAVRGQVSTAHPHHDGARGYSYVIEMGRRSVYRLFADEGGRQQVLAELPVERPAYMHSFGMSERFLVLAEFPLRVNPLRLKFSREPFIRSYRWEPERGTRFTVIDKGSGEIVARARGAPVFAFHHVNAFEEGGALHVDLLAYPDPRIIERLRLARLRSGEPVEAVARLTRFRVPLDAGPEREAPHETLSDAPLELPRIDYARRAGRPVSCVWGAGLSRPGRLPRQRHQDRAAGGRPRPDPRLARARPLPRRARVRGPPRRRGRGRRGASVGGPRRAGRALVPPRPRRGHAGGARPGARPAPHPLRLPWQPLRRPPTLRRWRAYASLSLKAMGGHRQKPLVPSTSFRGDKRRWTMSRGIRDFRGFCERGVSVLPRLRGSPPDRPPRGRG